MITHYLKFSRRLLRKYKYYTLVSVFGLASGMFGTLIIGKYIGASLQVDAFHTNREQIYSISQQEFGSDNIGQETPTTYQGVADLAAQFPEVVHTTKYMQHVESSIISKRAGGHESFIENRIFISDSNFFKVFTFSFLHGNSKSAFSRNNSMVLSRSSAQKYFRDENPIGKVLSIRTSWGEEISYEVTGVTEEISKLSRFRFDFLVNRSTPNPNELWNFPDYSIFALLRDSVDPAKISQEITAHLQRIPDLKSTNKTVAVKLNALADVELSHAEYLLITVAIMIVIICWANYINQTIGQAFWRIKEVGVVKMLGAAKGSLIMQFAVESALICGVSLILVFVVYFVAEDSLQFLTHGHLLPLFDDSIHINTIFLFIFLTGIAVASFASSFVVLRQSVAGTLTNSFTPRIHGIGVRKIFVLVQFSISTALIIGIFVITKQLDYMTSEEKGINLDDVIVVKSPMAKDTTWLAKVKTLQLFKQQVVELPFVKEVASSTTVPSEEYRQETYLSMEGNDSKILVHQNGVDENFFSLYEIQFVAGQDFIPNARATNSESIILNEAAAKSFGFSDLNMIINAKVIDHENPDVVFHVIGVVRDFHQTSLKFRIRPLAFKYNLSRGHCSLRLNERQFGEGTMDDKISVLKGVWRLSYPDASFDYFFPNAMFLTQDQEDIYFGRFFQAFTILSVILSSLGLFGLSILISNKRKKEVGVRKTFGATSVDILKMFLLSYLGPLMIAIALGSISAYLLMSYWLTNYAHRIEIGPGIILSGVLTLTAIFLATVSYQTIKAASANPTIVLRN